MHFRRTIAESHAEPRGQVGLAKVAGPPGQWDAGAVLSVGDAESFEATVAFDVVDTPSFVLGVAQAAPLAEIADDAEDLLAELVGRSPEGCFLQVLATSGYPLLCRPEGRPAFIDDFGAVATGLTLRYEARPGHPCGQVTFSANHRVFGPLPVPRTRHDDMFGSYLSKKQPMVVVESGS